MRLIHSFETHRDSVYYGLSTVYLLSGLGAYQLASVPVQWLGSVLSVFLLLTAFLSQPKFDREVFYPVWLILLVSLISIAGALFWGAFVDFEGLLPSGATTGYIGFTFLRYFQFAAFVAVYLVCTLFLTRYGTEALAKVVTAFGFLVSLYALYVYVAQVSGFPELIPRNRLGTGGEGQSVIFTYAFHRAMGSFREPSHLAQWLVLPIFMTLVLKSNWAIAARVTMLGVLLLTGSLTGIGAVLIGYMVSVVLVFPFQTAISRIGAFLLIGLASAALFTIFVVPNIGGSIDILSVISDRLQPILTGGGLLASNRGYVYEYIFEQAFPLFGYGLGNGNILFGDYQGMELMGSFLSFYVNMLYAVGYLGFAVIVTFLAIPVIVVLRRRRDNRRLAQSLLAGYLGWLVVFLVSSEELTISFAISYAACIYYYVAQKRVLVELWPNSPHSKPIREAGI